MRNIEKTKTFTHIGHKTYETHTKDKQINKQTNKTINKFKKNHTTHQIS